MTIGPHEGRELELMLSGEKKLAAFGNIIPDDGEINDIIIPESKFAPYVEKGQIVRIEDQFPYEERVYKSVCFTLPNEEWRAHFWHWYYKRLFSEQHKYNPEDEYILGSLLNYELPDIQEFFVRMKTKIS